MTPTAKTILILAAGTLALTGCGSPDCSTLPAPTSAQKQAAREVVRSQAVEVEVELENSSGSTECVVDSDTGRWTDVDEE